MNNDKFKNSWLGNYYEVGGAIMISLAFLLFIFEGYKIVFQNKPEPSPITLISQNETNYHQVYEKIKKSKQTDSFQIAQLAERNKFIDSIQVLNRKIEEVRIDNTDTENKVKIVASIIAVIVAAVGFFGFKSLNDIREHTIKNSQIDAQLIAKETAKKISKETAKKMAKETLETYRSEFASLKPLIISIENSLNEKIQNLNNQLSVMEEKNAGIANRLQVLEEKGGEQFDMTDDIKVDSKVSEAYAPEVSPDDERNKEGLEEEKNLFN